MGRRGLIGLVALALLLELCCRVLGLADVPVRLANPVTGHIPLPLQRGRFLNNEWIINDLSMITAAPYDRRQPSVVLAGDSVLFGGNPLDQSERVGERLSALLRRTAYTIADGNWGFKNALAYFLAYRAKLGEPTDIVFVLNEGDFRQPSQWRCFSYHPTSPPLSAAYFALRKYSVPECEHDVPLSARVPDFSLAEGLDRVVTTYPHTRVALLLYPTREELLAKVSIRSKLDSWLSGRVARWRVVDLIEVTRAEPQLWRPEHYADGIHPNAEGAAALARVIAERVLSVSGQP